MLFTKLVEREADEMDRLTIAVASGTGIAWGGTDAAQAWEQAREQRKAPAVPQGDPVTARNIQLARMRQMFPRAVKVN